MRDHRSIGRLVERRRANANYSRFVRGMRVLVPALAVLTMVTVFAWPYLNAARVPTVFDDDPDRVEMMDARYFSADENRQPYSVTAERAEQSSDSMEIYNLTRPTASMRMTDGAAYGLRASEGRYDESREQLELTGDVHMFDDAGYDFFTDIAYVDMPTGLAWSDMDVRGEGPAGSIESKGFRVIDEGQAVIFTGRSRLVLNSSSQSNRLERP